VLVAKTAWVVVTRSKSHFSLLPHKDNLQRMPTEVSGATPLYTHPTHPPHLNAASFQQKYKASIAPGAEGEEFWLKVPLHVA